MLRLNNILNVKKLLKNLNFLPTTYKANNLIRFTDFNFTSSQEIEKHMDFKIVNKNDIEDLKKKVTKTSTPPIHLDLKENLLTNENFKDLFDCLSEVQQEEFHFDLTNVAMTDEKIDAIKKCFSKWNIKHLEMHLSNSKFSEKQFKNLMVAIKGFKNLYFLHLEMENMGLTREQKNQIENLLNELNTLRNIYINIRNNQIEEKEVEVYKKLLKDVHIKTLLL